MKKLLLCFPILFFVFSCAATTANTPHNNEINKFSDRNQTKSEKKDIVMTSEGEKRVVHIDTTANHTPPNDITDIITGEQLVEPEKNREEIKLNLEEPKKKDSSNLAQVTGLEKKSPPNPSGSFFAVQAGVFSEVARADKVRFFIEDILRKNNHAHGVFLIPHDKHYKVQVRNLSNRQQADSIVSLLRDNGYESFVVLPTSN